MVEMETDKEEELEVPEEEQVPKQEFQFLQVPIPTEDSPIPKDPPSLSLWYW